MLMHFVMGKHMELCRSKRKPRVSHEILPAFPVGLQSSIRSVIKMESQGEVVFPRD